MSVGSSPPRGTTILKLDSKMLMSPPRNTAIADVCAGPHFLERVHPILTMTSDRAAAGTRGKGNTAVAQAFRDQLGDNASQSINLAPVCLASHGCQVDELIRHATYQLRVAPFREPYYEYS